MGLEPRRSAESRMTISAAFRPRLPVQHGSSFAGDGGAALLALSTVMQELLSDLQFPELEPYIVQIL